MVEEKIKIQNIQVTHGLLPSGVEIDNNLQKSKEIIKEEDLLYQMPSHLDVDTIANNREVIDKPIQWTAGMMEVPASAPELGEQISSSR